MPETLDVLAVMAHPDDAELLCGGALAASADRGERVGILSLTNGGRGTRGSAAQREKEAAEAAEILGVSVRDCAGLPDAELMPTLDARRVVVERIRALAHHGVWAFTIGTAALDGVLLPEEPLQAQLELALEAAAG